MNKKSLKNNPKNNVKNKVKNNVRIFISIFIFGLIAAAYGSRINSLVHSQNLNNQPFQLVDERDSIIVPDYLSSPMPPPVV
jgi:hypothetical protein